MSQSSLPSGSPKWGVIAGASGGYVCETSGIWAIHTRRSEADVYLTISNVGVSANSYVANSPRQLACASWRAGVLRVGLGPQSYLPRVHPCPS